MLRPEGCVKLEGMEPAAVIQGDRAAESRRGDIKGRTGGKPEALIQGDKAYGIAERQEY